MIFCKRVDPTTKALAALGYPWRYTTEQGLTFRSPTTDRRRSRWPLLREWR
jgi:hypothetical protein